MTFEVAPWLVVRCGICRSASLSNSIVKATRVWDSRVASGSFTEEESPAPRSLILPGLRMEHFYPAASKSKLEHVKPDSAFCNSEMSIGRTLKPAVSKRAFVRGNDAG